MSNVLSFFNSYWKRKPLTSFMVFITALIEPVIYLYVMFLTADIVGILENGGGWSEIWGTFVLFFPLIIIQVGLFFLSSFINEILAHRITTDMTYDLFNSLQNRSLTYHDSTDVGKIMARATNDTRSVNMGLSPGIRHVLATLSVWAVAGYALYLVEPLLLIPGILTVIIYSYLTVKYAQRVSPISDIALEQLAEISSVTSDSLTGIRDIKSYVALTWIKTKFLKRTFDEAKTKEREGTAGAWFYPDLFMRIFTLGAIGYALYLTAYGSIDFAQLILVASILGVVNGMSSDNAWVAFVNIQSIAAMQRLNTFIHADDPDFIQDGTIEFHNLPASIEFRNVNFKYPKRDQLVLKDVSFKIEDSETLAIVGSPGSGKSTLTKLIQRLYIPNSGEILIGDNNVNSYTNDSMRMNITNVEQEIALFNDTIIENIRFGKPQVSEEQVVEVAKISHAHGFISELKEGYYTEIGDNGVKLSGGQAQRIAIARAILMNPDILIFDDGASALDAKTELQIQNAIADILKTRTTVVTTHRLAIIAQADKILILDKGEVVGFGSHETLIQSNPYYRQLFERHFELPPLQEVKQ